MCQLIGLQDQHAIAKAEEPIPLLHRMAIGRHGVVIARKGADQHDQGAFRQMKVGQQPVDYLKPITGIDEDVGPAFGGTDDSLGHTDAFQGAAAGGPHRDDPPAPLSGPVDQIGCLTG